MTAAVSTAWMAAEGLELRDLETAAAAAASRAAPEGREVLGLERRDRERLEVRDRREEATEVVLEVASDSAVVQEGLVRRDVLAEVHGRLEDSRGHHRQQASWGSSEDALLEGRLLASDLEARQADWRDQETEQGM